MLVALGRDIWHVFHRPATLTHRFTVNECYKMAETGILKPGARVELIEGEIVDRMPTGPFHRSSGSFLNAVFNQLAAGRWVMWNQYPLHLDEFNESEPDLMLVKPPLAKYKRAHPQPEDVFLMIEISDSSLVRDQQTKLPLYARAGVEEVWILNIPQRHLEVYRRPNFLGYESKQVFREGAVAPSAFPDAAVNLTELLN